jgi:acyl carrier protein
MHPLLWDNSFLALWQLAVQGETLFSFGKNFVGMHVGYRKVQVRKSAGSQIWSHATFPSLDDTAKIIEGNIDLYDENGDVIAKIDGLKYQFLEKQVFEEMMASVKLNQGIVGNVSEIQAQPSKIKVTAFQNALLHADPTVRKDKLKQYLAPLVAKILGISPPKLDPKNSLVVQGLESLMAIELRNRIQMELGITLPFVGWLEGASLNDLTDQVFVLFHVAENDAAAEDQIVGEDRLTI